MENDSSQNFYSADDLLSEYQKKLKKMQKIGRLQNPSNANAKNLVEQNVKNKAHKEVSVQLKNVARQVQYLSLL